MSNLAIKLLSYLGLLDIPEEKIKKYLAQKRVSVKPRSQRTPHQNESSQREPRKSVAGIRRG